ncbi:MAG: valine--tRNA ligase [Bacteroidetes bacterium]|nr:valine--tRNA ligase [Bacteroidota bacterium]MBS1930299.1 valine--tRNA ligase [Bacteroidota bacterium]
MELSKNFDHCSAEQNWYRHWLEKKYFHSTPDNRPVNERYTIVIPPPNVTGILHMGHCLNNTIQDILIRYARMQGKNTCWVPGTDHASIATEAKVVQMLREKGITKSSLTREEFLKYAWEWKEKYGGIILQQLKKLGCSCDWDRTAFTMDTDYYQSVIAVFIDLYNKGYIYRGKRMIHWDVKAKTALSDEEVFRKETKQKLVYIKYPLAQKDQQGNIKKINDSITIATVRPETIMADVAICVHPKDERYKPLQGKYALIPLIDKLIPIIADEYVSMDFGTGALKITPAHDANDFQIGLKHKLEIVDILNEDGTLNNEAQIFVGEDRFEARKKIVKELESKGFIAKIEEYTSEVGYSERTDAVVEPRLSLQWWVDMKKISEPALKAVMDGEIKFHPAKFKNLYRHWMENIKDWCISRQLWWGHRIPAWYDEQGRFVVARNEEEAKEIFNKQYPSAGRQGSFINVQLKQDEDVLDTWFSSWLWPFEVFHGLSNPGNADMKYYYPTQTLVTAPEIIFFWVARMIMAGYEYMKEKPFSDVYFTGIVRDELGRKMSKQLGNSPDLLGLIDKYGADAVRFGTIISSPAGNDLLFDVKEESTLKQGSFFVNKIWNALKLVRSWESRIGSDEPRAGSRESGNNFAVDWFENRLNEVKGELEKMLGEFRLSEALKTIYSLIWDDFCSWYLEWVKPEFEKPVDKKVYEKTIDFFEELMQLLHPFMPFVTEEIYHQLKERNESDDICVKLFPGIKATDVSKLQVGSLLKEAITAIRDARNKNQVKPKEHIKLHIQTNKKDAYERIKNICSRQINAENISFTDEAVPNSIAVVIQKDTFYIETERQVNPSLQKEQLQKDLEYQKGFLLSIEKKLNNERFVQNAKPEVIELEQKKKKDALAKIKVIEESLAAL